MILCRKPTIRQHTCIRHVFSPLSSSFVIFFRHSHRFFPFSTLGHFTFIVLHFFRFFRQSLDCSQKSFSFVNAFLSLSSFSCVISNSCIHSLFACVYLFGLSLSISSLCPSSSSFSFVAFWHNSLPAFFVTFFASLYCERRPSCVEPKSCTWTD